jgi:hypothetical protein
LGTSGSAYHQGQLAGEVVDDGDLFGQQQQDVGRAEGVGLAGLGEARLDVAHRVVAEAAHQAAGKARQAVARRHLDAGLELGDEIEGVAVVAALDRRSLVSSSTVLPRASMRVGAARPMIE